MPKQCFKCKQEKDPDSFYRHAQMADGHLGKCIDCTKKDVLEHRLANIDHIRAYDRQRGKLPHRKKLSSKTRTIYRKQYPKRYAANSLLGAAVRDCRVKKPKTCQNCGIKPRMLHGHHEDYYHPLDVMWLCPPCHKAQHNLRIPNG